MCGIRSFSSGSVSQQAGMQRYFGGAYFSLPLDRYFEKSTVGFGVWFWAHSTAGSVCVSLSCFCSVCLVLVCGI